jgi:hypothetical protein
MMDNMYWKIPYNYHFAYGFHPISWIFEEIICFDKLFGEAIWFDEHIGRLINSGIDENLNSCGRILLRTNAGTNLLEECSNCSDNRVRLDIIFELKRRGKTFFDLEIEEYILTRENFENQLYILERYYEETGKGEELYRHFLNTVPQRINEIIKSIARMNVYTLKSEVEKMANVNSERFNMNALFAYSLFEHSSASLFVEEYLRRYKNNERMVEELVDGLVEFSRELIRMRCRFSEEFIEKFVSLMIKMCSELKRRKCFEFLSLGILHPSQKIEEILVDNIDITGWFSHILELLREKLGGNPLCIDERISDFLSFPHEARELFYRGFIDGSVTISDKNLLVLIEKERENEELLRILMDGAISHGKFKLFRNNIELFEKIYYGIEIYRENFGLISKFLYVFFENGVLRDEHFDRLFI